MVIIIATTPLFYILALFCSKLSANVVMAAEGKAVVFLFCQHR